MISSPPMTSGVRYARSLSVVWNVVLIYRSSIACYCDCRPPNVNHIFVCKEKPRKALVETKSNVFVSNKPVVCFDAVEPPSRIELLTYTLRMCRSTNWAKVAQPAATHYIRIITSPPLLPLEAKFAKIAWSNSLFMWLPQTKIMFLFVRRKRRRVAAFRVHSETSTQSRFRRGLVVKLAYHVSLSRRRSPVRIRSAIYYWSLS